VRIRSQGGRDQVREAAVDAALRLLRDQLPA
jgi:nicotinamide mononucleotide (NMN) deamidase PncC